MNASDLLAKLHDHGITAHADDGRLRLDAPTGTLTPELLEAVKSYKQDLLKILAPSSLLLDDLGGSWLRSPSAASATQVHHTMGSDVVDAEFARFGQVAVRTETGGLRNPKICSAELARKIRSGGLPWESLEKSETDYNNIGRGAKA